MERYFNIGGPCNPADHYTLPAMARLPQVVSLIGKKQYFVVHVRRQCGETTTRGLRDSGVGRFGREGVARRRGCISHKRINVKV